MKRHGLSFHSSWALLLLLLVTLAEAPASALPWWDFQQCISSAGWAYGNICTLDAPPVNPYWVNQPLHIQRSNIIVQGTAVYRGQTTLKRFSTSLMRFFEVDNGVTGVQIQDFTLDGNRYALQLVNVPDYVKMAYIEINMGAPGVSYVTLLRVDFYNSPGYAVNASTQTHIFNSNAFYVGMSAVYAGSNTVGVIIASSNIYFSGGGAIALNSRDGYIWGNILYSNHREFPHVSQQYPNGASGGQIMLSETSRNYSVAYNIVNGGYVGQGCVYDWDPYICVPEMPYTAGFEIYGAKHTFDTNSVSYHRGNGIDLAGVNDPAAGGQPGDRVTVRSDTINFPYYRFESNYGDGISIGNILMDIGFLQVTHVDLIGVKSTNNKYSGVAFLTEHEGITGNINDVTIQNCCLMPNEAHDYRPQDIRYLGSGTVNVTVGCTNCNCP